MNYYNEWDPDAASWLRQLVKDGLIPRGVVDERSIYDVRPSDLRGFTQCHFFTGIGGWPRALLLAGWPEDRPVWTGSCPCQSFSVAGKGLGLDDPRGKLWFEFFRLIAGCRPARVFGEQVPGAIDHGWLDLVADDLGKAGYDFGAAVFSALSVGAPHLRERIYFFVADSDGVAAGEARQPVRDVVGPCFWSEADWVRCPDGKERLRRPGARLVADGIPANLALLRGAGNAIVPQQAAEFIRAYVEAKGGFVLGG
jgi:DNA (cytosine-5)-methyltransferase 1